MKKKLSLVVPVYFEEACIERFILETTGVLEKMPFDYEIVFIDDGSQDKTTSLIKSSAMHDQRIKLIEFSYNHGKQAALTAGIRFSSGDYLLHMDPDLQDPPYEIPRFVERLEEGNDLVFGIRKEKKDTFTNKIFSKLFWFVLNRFTGLNIPTDLAVMRIFNRKFADKFLEYSEQNRFIEGIFMHVGMRRATLLIDQNDRYAGVSKFNFRRKIKLALDAILDFSEIPLTMAARLGLLLSLAGLLGMLLILTLKLLLVDFQAGWPSLLSLLLTGFGVQLFFVGIAAIYIGRIYRETKHRPLFSILQMTNIGTTEPLVRFELSGPLREDQSRI
jgi:dolichol-phosphate mannosyltransferase